MNSGPYTAVTAGTRHIGTARPPASVRAILVRLVLVALLSGLVGSALVLYVTYRSERAQLELDTIQTARALVQSVDAELIKVETAAQMLSKSPYLRSGNLAAFYAQAKEIIELTGCGNNYVLSDRTGQQIVNTLKPFPGALPKHGSPEILQRVFATGRPVVSDIFIGGVLKRPLMTVDVPVMVNGQVAYALSLAILPERFGDLVRMARLPSDWVVAVFDTQGIVAARTHAPEQFVGKAAVPAVVKRIAEVPEGMVETRTLEGTRAFVAFSRSDVSRWSVGIGIPVDSFEGPLRQRFLLLLAVVLALAVAGFAVAWLLAGRIAQSIRALSAPALALGSGKAVSVPDIPLREAAEVAAAIGTASVLLEHRGTQLENANKELQDFSYAISHDLSTPLRAIAGYAQIIGEEHTGQLDEEGLRLLGRIRDSTLRMEGLIESLVDFMHLTRCPMDAVDIDMRQLVLEVFQRLQATHPKRSLRLEMGELPHAFGDRAMLRRVVENLLSNAVKFIPAQSDGLIVVAGETTAGEHGYHFSDNGVGFDMQYADKLFRAFERLHPPGAYPGLGSGLALIKRIVGRHGGRVWAEGRIGQGATFHFALPARIANPA